MQRGVLTLSKEEFNQLLSIIDINRFNQTPLYNKLISAGNTNEKEVRISISEDEIEKILDEVGPPIYENLVLNNALKKISALLISFRS
ncbi:MAG TPA: hypothetical protein P5059_03375 [Candidatus Dojkabacteria bacterium]|nr:hypothetical protein [Candidatus Dojkabacteria bacterium]